ncbi:alpha/beta hydrolase family protein [Actinomyces mediterranea]|uniref:hypothetical protein n=1 Tax=Actinomyces mediterranea TaxID=1871028 RepID=UPI0009707968|nr:hypothetical protein [Actinomyces mediterranea]
MVLLGMDVAAARQAALAFDRSADSLDAIRAEVSNLLRSTTWDGSDADAFRAMWTSRHQRTMIDSARAIRQAGATLRANASAQEDTSNDLGVGTGSSGGSPAGSRHGGGGSSDRDPGLPGAWDDWFYHGIDAVSDGIEWVGDRARDGLRWIGDRVRDGIEWTRDRIDDGKSLFHSVTTDLANRWNAFTAGMAVHARAWQSLNSQFTRIFTEGRIPQPAEILASVGLVLATGAGTVGNVVAGRDLNFFDDGKPWAGQPEPVSQRDAVEPQTIQDLLALGNSAYNHDGVQVVAVEGSDGTTRFIVAVAGTEPAIDTWEGWTGHPNGRDWPANVWGMANGTSSGTQAAQQAVDHAIEQYRLEHPDANIGEHPQLLMTGHSQGGIITSNMAADKGFSSRYNIQGMVTYGSPIDCAEIPSDVPVLALQHGASNPLRDFGDPVPRLDLGGWPGSADNITHGYLESPASGFDNHDQNAYVNSVRPGTPGGDLMTQWQRENPQIDEFFTNDPRRTEQYNVPFGRVVD